MFSHDIPLLFLLWSAFFILGTEAEADLRHHFVHGVLVKVAAQGLMFPDKK